ncbi:MAG: hypothetical protein AB7K09_11710 [Planctomycetota bacterium]
MEQGARLAGGLLLAFATFLAAGAIGCTVALYVRWMELLDAGVPNALFRTAADPALGAWISCVVLLMICLPAGWRVLRKSGRPQPSPDEPAFAHAADPDDGTESTAR